MRVVVYRTIAAVLAVVSGFVLAALFVALTDEGNDVNSLGAALYGVVGVVSAITALVLWVRAVRR